jgi:penicillin amidase
MKRSRRNRFLVILTIVLVIGAGAAGWWWVGSSVPIIDGQVTVAGLRSPVEILIDDHGVPAIYANEESDAWFAAGVLHARNRRWQMELYRRVVGASAGPRRPTIPFDRRFLTLGLRE